MKLIDRYIYAVTQYLPEGTREDVGKELRANIEDMLPEQPTEKDIIQVLEELGNPWKLANEYNPSKRYLIGPGYYENYLSVLKLVIGICAAVFVGLAVFAWAVDPSVEGDQINNLTALITDLIGAAVDGVLQGALWVTIVFVLLERSGVEPGQLPFHNKKWSPEDLPELPLHNKRKISRGETVFSMFFTIFFTALFYFKPQYIAMYVKGESGKITATPLFDLERLQSYLWIILLLAIIQLGFFIWKYISGSWNIPMAIGNAVYNAVSCILLIVMLSDHSLYNAEFFSKIDEIFTTSSPVISTWLDRSIWITVSAIIIICVWDSISAFFKCFSRSRG
ncbi:MAG: hypothetical protein K0S47_3494 [Herbinix sp.]|jgi:hypothetical protein|nr:hypothetical protein [Herbinix sp.]